MTAGPEAGAEMRVLENMSFPGNWEPEAGVKQAITETWQRLERMGEENHWDMQTAFRTNLALEEIITNVIIHGGRAGKKTPDIEVRIESSRSHVLMEVLDDGIPFDPLEDGPTVPGMRSLDEARMGGVGIHLVVRITDHVEYQRENSRNRLTITVNRTDEESGAPEQGPPEGI